MGDIGVGDICAGDPDEAGADDISCDESSDKDSDLCCVDEEPPLVCDLLPLPALPLLVSTNFLGRELGEDIGGKIIPSSESLSTSK